MITDNIQQFNESVGVDGAVEQKQYTAAEIQALTIPSGITSYVSDTDGNLWKCTAADKVIISTQEDISEINKDINTINIDLSLKVDKVPGKGLSTNDFTNADKEKLEEFRIRTGYSIGSTEMYYSNPQIRIRKNGADSNYATPIYAYLGRTYALISGPKTTWTDTGIRLPEEAANYPIIRLLCNFSNRTSGAPYNTSRAWDYVDIVRRDDNNNEVSYSYGTKEFCEPNSGSVGFTAQELSFYIDWGNRSVYIRTGVSIARSFYIQSAYGWSPQLQEPGDA